MSADKIIITGIEFDSALIEGSHKRQIIEINAIGFFRGGAHSSVIYPEKIPDDVRIAIAMLVAPGLVEAKR